MGRPRRWNTVECGRASRYAAFGAFTSLYGRNHLHMPRVVMQLTVGAAMVVAVVGGVLVGTLSSAVHAVGDVGNQMIDHSGAYPPAGVDGLAAPIDRPGRLS